MTFWGHSSGAKVWISLESIYAERNKGAYVMGEDSMDIDNLLSRSQSLAQSKRKDGDA